MCQERIVYEHNFVRLRQTPITYICACVVVTSLCFPRPYEQHTLMRTTTYSRIATWTTIFLEIRRSGAPHQRRVLKSVIVRLIKREKTTKTRASTSEFRKLFFYIQTIKCVLYLKKKLRFITDKREHDFNSKQLVAQLIATFLKNSWLFRKIHVTLLA